MLGLTEKYVNPFTDFGFKKLFGEEPNKDLLMDFLSELLREEQGEIKSLTYLKNEHLDASRNDRRAIFDLYCENERGEKFIVELQKTKQNYFKDRTLYYSTFPIIEQAQQGDWNYELKAVYTIGILDFVFDEDRNEPEKYRYNVKLMDIETKKIFYNKFTFVYLEMPKFKKTVEELETRFDKWMYVLKNLSRLEAIPDRFKEKIFEKLFKKAEIANFSRDEAINYQDSLKIYRDNINTLASVASDNLAKGEQIGIAKGEQIGIAKGEQIGEMKGKREIARKMIAQGFDQSIVAELSGLTIEEVRSIA